VQLAVKLQNTKQKTRKMGSSAKFYKKPTRKQKEKQSEISKVKSTPESSVNTTLNKAISKRKRKKVDQIKKQVNRADLEIDQVSPYPRLNDRRLDDLKGRKDYVDVFSGKKTYKSPLAIIKD
jgi:anti-sigma28 factor (negative regulator of flagellin synthesis)